MTTSPEVSLEAMLPQYSKFYLDHGIRSTSQLISLRRNTLEGFVFPIYSTLHYTPRDIAGLGITPDDPLIANMGDRILIDVIGDYLGDEIGAPIKKPRVLINEIRQYIKKHKQFKYVEQAKALEEIRAVPKVLNYSSLDVSYKYRTGMAVFFQRRYNYYNTVIAHVAKELSQSARHQFVLLDVPDLIPPVSRLKEAEADIINRDNKNIPMDLKHRQRFNTDASFLVLHLWLWCGKNHRYSIFDQLPVEQLDRVDLMFVVDDRYSILNMGQLNTWIKRAGDSTGLFTENKAQLTILRHFMSLQQISSVSDDVVVVDDASLADIRALIDNGSESDPELAQALNQISSLVRETDIPVNVDVNIDATGVTKAPINIDIKSKSKKPIKNENQRLDNKLADLVTDETNPEEIGSIQENEILGEELERDLKQLEILEAQREANKLDEVRDYVAYKPTEQQPTTVIDKLTDDLADRGLLSAAEVRRAKALGRRYQQIKSPFDESQSVAEFSKISPEALKISPVTKIRDKNITGLMDESMMSYSIKDFDSRYIEEVLNKDVTNAFLHVQQAGVAVTDMNLKRVDEYLGSYVELSVQLTPVVGTPTTVKAKLPLPNSDGIMVSNGVHYKMRKQRVDLPIRKVTESSVALTSYMSKMFVNRTARVAFDPGNWLTNQINIAGMDENSPISEIIHSDVYVREIKLPRSYTAIARKMAGFLYGTAQFSFDYNRIDTIFPADLLKAVDRTKYVPIGFKRAEPADGIFVLDMNDNMFVIYPSAKRMESVGRIVDFLGLPSDSEPVEYAEVGLMGKSIPVGILLAYRIGLGNLLKTSGVKFRRNPRGQRINPIQDDEFGVRFEDETLVFSKRDAKAALLFNGFNRLKNTINRMSVYSLDKPDVYVRLLEALGAPPRHLKDYDFMFNCWVDHITRDLLLEMNEPTDMVLLFLSAIDKLTDDQHEDPNGIKGSYIRGYQRIAGMVYAELFKSLRQYNSSPMSKNARVELNPNAIWFSIIQDQTVGPIEESNPIHSIKENEVVVFRGQGGRSSDTMTAKHRQFAQDAIGVVSEANVDNGSVGTITYLTADPNITSLRGVNKALDDLTNVPRTKVQSTAMLLSPGSDMDDSKRVTFTNVMFTSTSFLYNAVPNRVQTGAERTVAYRTDSSWARVAKLSGKVKSVDKDLISVEYEDGTIENISIGRKFGTWSGVTIPHDIIPNFAVGDKFDKDDVLAYNSHYFQKDTLDPKLVVFKRGMIAKMVMWEAMETLEDACAISRAYGSKLSTGVTEKRAVKVPFDHDIEMLVKLGQNVDLETILCNLRPPLSGMGNSYSEQARAALDVLSTLTPKAQHHGVVDHIEVIYSGDIDHMSESLQEIVSRSDNALYRKNKALGIPVKTAQVDPGYRINNSDITPNHVVLIFYITEKLGAGVGDKLVFGNQMKSIISKVVEEPYVAEDGTVIDVAFSRQSVSNRIVNSMDLIATTNTVLSLIEKEAIDDYYGDQSEP